MTCRWHHHHHCHHHWRQWALYLQWVSSSETVHRASDTSLKLQSRAESSLQASASNGSKQVGSGSSGVISPHTDTASLRTDPVEILMRSFDKSSQRKLNWLTHVSSIVMVLKRNRYMILRIPHLPLLLTAIKHTVYQDSAVWHFSSVYIYKIPHNSKLKFKQLNGPTNRSTTILTK